MEGERVVFSHEEEPSHHLRLVVSGDVDIGLLEALEAYITLQKKRIERKSAMPIASEQKIE